MLRNGSRYAFCLWLLSASAWAVPLTGTVYRDLNGNGRREAAEPGWPGVALSDGLTFATTDAQGVYRLDAQPDPLRGAGAAPLVAVCWPGGSWPSGRWHAQVTGPGPLDFGLQVVEQKLPFRFVHGTDAHVPRGGQAKMVDFKAEVARLRPAPALTVLTGDNVDLSDSHPFDQGKAQWDFLAEQTATWPTPLLMTGGNHDIAGVRAKPGTGWDAASPLFGYGFYTRLIGPLRWSFDYAGVHLVGLDFNALVDGQWVWGVPDNSADWLRADLARVPRDTRVYLFVHYPQSPGKRFPELIKEGRVTQIFTGHSHVDRAWRYQGTPVLVAGSLSQVFDDKDRDTGYRLVEVTADGFASFYKTTGAPHAITVDQPRHETTLQADQPVKGQFYDPDGRITKLTVTFGDETRAVPFQRASLACRFETTFDLSKLPAGSHPLTVAVSDGQQTWRWSFKYRKYGSRAA